MSLYFILPVFIAVCSGIMYFCSKMQYEEREQKHRHELELRELEVEDAYAKGYNDGYIDCMRKHGYEPIDEQSDS